MLFGVNTFGHRVASLQRFARFAPAITPAAWMNSPLRYFHLSPLLSAQRHRGSVDRVSDNYGFIVKAGDRSRLFFHARDVPELKGRKVSECIAAGREVEFELAEDASGKRCVDVVLVNSKSDASKDDAGSKSPAVAKPSDPLNASDNRVHSGVVDKLLGSYGFIQLKDGPRYFFHRDAVAGLDPKNPPTQLSDVLRVGMQVECRVVHDLKAGKLCCSDVRVKGVDIKDAMTASATETAARCDSKEVFRGRVDTLQDRGYGFFIFGNRQRVFFHLDDLVGKAEQFKKLKPGDRVEFRIGESRGKRRATDIKVLKKADSSQDGDDGDDLVL